MPLLSPPSPQFSTASYTTGNSVRILQVTIELEFSTRHKMLNLCAEECYFVNMSQLICEFLLSL